MEHSSPKLDSDSLVESLNRSLLKETVKSSKKIGTVVLKCFQSRYLKPWENTSGVHRVMNCYYWSLKKAHREKRGQTLSHINTHTPSKLTETSYNSISITICQMWIWTSFYTQISEWESVLFTKCSQTYIQEFYLVIEKGQTDRLYRQTGRQTGRQTAGWTDWHKIDRQADRQDR